MAQINRTGTVSFGDASLSIWEEPPGRGSVSREWERNFKRDVTREELKGWETPLNEVIPVKEAA